MDPKKLPLAVLMTLGLGDGCVFKPCLSMVIETGGDDSGADDSGADDSGADDSASDDSAASEAKDRAEATERVLARGALPADVAAALAEGREE